MKKQIPILALSMLALPVFAQTNETEQPRSEEIKSSEHKPGMHPEKRGDRGDRQFGQNRRDMSEEEKAERNERRLQLMEKTLEQIGITPEQRKQIIEMQVEHKKAMKRSYRAVNDERKKLSQLEESSASQEKIYAAIDAVSSAQAEQMKVLTRNRMEMERILGKEKFHEFMDVARKQYRKHGRQKKTEMPFHPKENKEIVP